MRSKRKIPNKKEFEAKSFPLFPPPPPSPPPPFPKKWLRDVWCHVERDK
jgi:hypothetical protein